MSTCHEERRVTVATLVDHVVPHRGDPALFWDVENWQSLCATCHARKTAAGL
jgi:5-methylcytosine-specific restriction protein A